MLINFNVPRLIDGVKRFRIQPSARASNTPSSQRIVFVYTFSARRRDIGSNSAMELQGERLIHADIQRTWSALNDPVTLKACIAGCEVLERSGDNSFKSVVAVKVGPVSARFNGKLELTNVQPPRGYTINFEGQGGAAGFGKGSSDVSLEAEGENTRLRYTARAQVGGKMAQIGSRLIDATARKMTDDFFKAFEEQLRPPAMAADEAPALVPEHVAVADAGGGGGGMRSLWWLIGALLVAAVIYFMLR